MINCPYCNSDYKEDDIGRVIFKEHLGEVHRLSSKESKAVLFAKEVSLEYMEKAHQWWDDNLNQHQKPWDDMNIPERSQVITAFSRYVLSGAESVDWGHIFDDDIAEPNPHWKKEPEQDANPTKDFVDALSDAGQGGEPMYYNRTTGGYSNDELNDISQDPTIGADWQRGEEINWKKIGKDLVTAPDVYPSEIKHIGDEEFLWNEDDYGKYKNKFLKKNPQLNEDDFERKIDGSDYYNKESKAKEANVLLEVIDLSRPFGGVMVEDWEGSEEEAEMKQQELKSKYGDGYSVKKYEMESKENDLDDSWAGVRSGWRGIIDAFKNPEFEDWSEDKKAEWKSLNEDERKTWKYTKEDDPDFLNDPDFQGYTQDEFGNKIKSHPSQYTLSGWDWEEKERMLDRGDVDSLEGKDEDDLDEYGRNVNQDESKFSDLWKDSKKKGSEGGFDTMSDEDWERLAEYLRDWKKFKSNLVNRDDFMDYAKIRGFDSEQAVAVYDYYTNMGESKANEDSLLKVEDNDDGGVDVTVLDEWENKGSIEKAIQAGNDDKSTFTVQEESFSDAYESNNPPNGQTKASEIEEEEFNKKHFDIEEEEGFGVVYKCKHCGEWLSADMPVGQHAEHIMFDHNIQESNAVGNYQDPAINEEYDREVDQYYVNQDIPLEDPKDG